MIAQGQELNREVALKGIQAEHPKEPVSRGRCGHLLPEERPDQVIAELRQF